MNGYQISLKLEGQPCLVVGGGLIAERKIKSLLECGADVTVVSPELSPELAAAASAGEFRYLRRGFRTSDLDGLFLVISATDEQEINHQIAGLCRKRGILVNVVDNPQLSTFFVTALVRRGPLSIGISTGGTSPLLARRLREYLESEIGPEFGELAVLLGKLREQVQTSYPDQAQRHQIWENILTRDTIDLIKSGQLDLFRKRVDACISSLSELTTAQRRLT